MSSQTPDITESGDNLYAEFGFADPELEQAKAVLARAIRSAIESLGMTQIEAGKMLDISQADVSRITRGRLGGFSTDRLITYLTRLNLDVQITVRKADPALTVGRVLAVSVE